MGEDRDNVTAMLRSLDLQSASGGGEHVSAAALQALDADDAVSGDNGGGGGGGGAQPLPSVKNAPHSALSAALKASQDEKVGNGSNAVSAENRVNGFVSFDELEFVEKT